MCGIAGIYSKSTLSETTRQEVLATLEKMQYRGPDFRAIAGYDQVILGHTRLSIIDTSEKANQPMFSADRNFALVFNGEIFNFHELKNELLKEGIVFETNSDTEVLLNLLIRQGTGCLNRLNGFFSFAFYNHRKNELLLARDRYGEKPLKYAIDGDRIIFGSEVKSVAGLIRSKKISYEALELYFRFNYIPAPYTIYNDIKKLMPGHYLRITEKGHELNSFYQLPETPYLTDIHEIKKTLTDTLHDSVKKRLITDVPLGCFLSGGIDSTIIAGIAKEYDSSLNTFSIGFPDDPHFDETEFANEASRFLGTNHTVFNVGSKTLLDNFENVIGKMDEPFADSSALAVYELARQTRTKVTVALSGDGADEIFAGYYKHLAHYRSIRKNLSNAILKRGAFLLSGMKGSRNNKFSNKIRQLKKYSEALKLTPVDKYIRWASFLSVSDLNKFLKTAGFYDNFFSKTYLNEFKGGEDLNEVLRTDIKLVLANDMLVKVDLMSMANSLEVRPPFLDHRVVELALKIPAEFKIANNSKKHILKETFTDYLPSSIVNRPKKGFEVPLQPWFNKELKNDIEKKWMSKEFLKKQGLFNEQFTEKLKKNIFSDRPGDSIATTWAMIVFQEWINTNEIEL